MCENFVAKGNIATLRNSVPIQFVHMKSMDNPKNHVLHINNYLEIYVYVKGNHKYIVEDKIYELKPGDIVLINPREVHKVLPMTECLYERFYLLVDERCFDGLVHNPLTSILKPARNIDNLVSPNSKVREKVLELLYEVSDCFANGKNRQLQAMTCVLQLLDICNEQLLQKQPTAECTLPVPKLLERIFAYVAKNTASIHSTTQIAKDLGLSPQYLSSYFSKHIGTPLCNYVQAKKIALAKDLLAKGLDITSTCFNSGFNDCSYFIRVFKKHVGITPLHYQQNLNK